MIAMRIMAIRSNPFYGCKRNEALTCHVCCCLEERIIIFFNRSRLFKGLPVPITTVVNGSSTVIMGRFVSSLNVYQDF